VFNLILMCVHYIGVGSVMLKTEADNDITIINIESLPDEQPNTGMFLVLMLGLVISCDTILKIWSG